MAEINLVEGPIGAGKTTFALDLAANKKIPFLCLDEWIAQLFIPDRPAAAGVDWYLDRKARCLDLIWKTALEVVRGDQHVVLELGLLTVAAREEIYARAEEAGAGFVVYVLDAPVRVREERVRARNLERGKTWSVDITDAMFHRSNAWWQPPTAEEWADRRIVAIDGQRLTA